jgi:D-3-phosphoglycerate dehydrogenase
VAEQVEEVLRGGVARAAVNAPMILPETLRTLQPWMALVEKLGRIYTQLHPGPLHRAELVVSGEIAEYDTRPLKTALIKGLLESVSEAHVNMVNAQHVAHDWGLEVTESRSTTAEQYANLVTVRVSSNGEGAPDGVVAATRAWGEERIVRVDRYATDFTPRGSILICHNVDKPGMIGRVGTVLGDAGVNIAHMDVGPVASGIADRGRHSGGEALMVLSLDNAVPTEAVERIRQMPDITDTAVITL